MTLYHDSSPFLHSCIKYNTVLDVIFKARLYTVENTLTKHVLQMQRKSSVFVLFFFIYTSYLVFPNSFNCCQLVEAI